METKPGTKENLLNVARKEFLEKGYQGASLRTICQKANVTTGALYFFFANKEDLFSQVIGDVLDQFENILFHQKLDDSQSIRDFLCQHTKEMYLILFATEGTHFAYLVDDFCSILEKHLQEYLHNEDEQWIHILAEMKLKGYAEILTKAKDNERRMELMDKLNLFYGC